MVTKLQLEKLREELREADPALQPRALIVEYEADGGVKIHPLNWSGTDAQAKEFLSQEPYRSWPQIYNDIPRLELPRPNERTFRVFMDTGH